MAKKTWPGG